MTLPDRKVSIYDTQEVLANRESRLMINMGPLTEHSGILKQGRMVVRDGYELRTVVNK